MYLALFLELAIFGSCGDEQLGRNVQVRASPDKTSGTVLARDVEAGRRVYLLCLTESL
jgi:hypothetical protein